MPSRYTRRADGTTSSIIQDNIVNVSLGTATQAIDQIAFRAPYPMQFVGVAVTYTTASTSGTLNVEKCPVGTAAGSGTDLLSSTIDLSATAGVTYTGTLITTVSSLQLAAGDRLALDFGGTVTNLVNCQINLILKRIQAVGSDK